MAEEKQKSKDSLEVVIKRRNKRLEDFFKSAIPEELGNIRIIGDENKPAIIYNDSFLLACYVHNFDLRLNSNDSGNELIMNVKLTMELNYDKETFLNWLHNANHRTVYKVKLSQTANNLFLCGWNFIDKENCKGRYPVFSKHEPKLYFKESVAQAYADALIEDGYLVEVV